MPDDVIVCCSGGGLVAGIALALEARLPGTRVWAAEPAGFDDHRRSLAAGQRVRNEQAERIDLRRVDESDAGRDHVRDESSAARRVRSSRPTTKSAAAVAWAARALKLIVEPGGAVALACVRNARLPTDGRTIVVVLTGGNIDPTLLREILAGETRTAP